MPRFLKTLSLLLLVLGTLAIAQAALASEPTAPADGRMGWWRDARFGMFIHWGVYSVTNGRWGNGTWYAEWVRNNAKIPIGEYEKLSAQFDPVDFNAAEWVRAAKDAGMKYLVITAKHHDGFCMFDSAYTDYDIVDATPFHRDPLAELSRECRRQGIRFGVYYSIMDWHHPDYLPRRPWEKRSAEGADYGRYVQYVHDQVAELIRKYDPAIIWFDGGWEDTWTPEDGRALVDMIRKLKPDIIINNRARADGDFETPEQVIPKAASPGRDWETCMTMNDHWGWNAADTHWKAPRTIVRNLVDIASKGGNYLLNVGPKPNGQFPEQAIMRLRDVGEWMRTWGTSIYGTTAGPFRNLSWGRCTTKPGKLYLHVFDWPVGKLDVPGLANDVTRAYLLSDPARTPLSVERSGDSVLVTVPKAAPDPTDSVVVLEIEGAPNVLQTPITQSSDGAVTLEAADATVHGGTARYESGGGKDDIGFWTEPSDWVDWTFELKHPGRFTVQVTYACPSETAGARCTVSIGDQKLDLTVKATGSWTDWKTVDIGQVALPIAGRYTLALKPVQMPGYAVMNLKSVTFRPL